MEPQTVEPTKKTAPPQGESAEAPGESPEKEPEVEGETIAEPQEIKVPEAEPEPEKADADDSKEKATEETKEAAPVVELLPSPKSVNDLMKVTKMTFTNWEIEALINATHKPQQRNNVSYIRKMIKVRKHLGTFIKDAPVIPVQADFFKDIKNQTDEEKKAWLKAVTTYNSTANGWVDRIKLVTGLNRDMNQFLRTAVSTHSSFPTDDASAERVLLLADKFLVQG